MRKHSIRLILRAWRKDLKQTLVTVGTLATGLTCVLLVVALLNGFVLRPLPFRNAEQLALVGVFSDEWGSDYLDSASSEEILEIQRRLAGLAEIGGFERISVTLSDTGLAQREFAANVSANLFDMLGVAPLLGRPFDTNDEKPGVPAVAVISERVWRSRYGADPNILGRVIRIDGQPVVVSAVMPGDFSFPIRESIWLPGKPTTEPRYDMLMRRAPGIGNSAVVAALQAWFEQAQHEHPDRFQAKHVGTSEVRNITWGGSLRQPLYLMLACTVLLLLLACASAANLLSVRVWSQRRNLIVRVALGATRGDIIRQVLTESLMLAVAAAAVALLFTDMAVHALIAWFRAHDFGPARWQHFEPDLRMLLLSGLAVFAAALLAGVPAAVSACRASIGQGLRDTAHTAIERPSRALGALVLLQVVLSCALLISVGMMVREIFAVDAADLGIAPEHLLTSRIAVPKTYASESEQRAFLQQMRERLQDTPGVANVSIGTAVPGTSWNHDVSVAQANTASDDNRIPTARSGIVDQHFFDTYGVMLQEGRVFDDRDASDRPHVAVVDRRFAAQFSPDQPIVGRQFQINPHAADAQTVTVIGVVGELKMNTRVQPRSPAILFAATQSVLPATLSVTVRSRPDVYPAAMHLDRTLADLDRDVPVSFAPYEDVLADQVKTIHVFARMFYVVGIVAIVLVASGLYGVMMVGVSRRTREIGLRRALGSPASHVLRIVFGELAGLALVGTLLGFLIGIPLARFLDQSLIQFGDSANPLVLFGTLVVLLGAIACGTVVPVLRALRLDPARALRSE